MVELKIFENWSWIKIIWKKTRVLKFIWKLKSWKLNLKKKFGILKKNIWKWEFWKLNLKIGILKIKFERNWSFENYLKIGKLNLRIGISKIKFERNWNFEN